VSEKKRLSHVDEHGTARMVDVSEKADTERVARATGVIRMLPDTLQTILSGSVAKGDVLTVSRIAGIMAAKRTAELIPLCHPLPVTDVQVTLSADQALPGLRAEATVRTVGKTGVEMEALTAVSVTLLTVYDMAKAIDRSMVISDVLLQAKGGGRSGDWVRS
jgi:cyclic pyranopterin monophosphate synthase